MNGLLIFFVFVSIFDCLNCQENNFLEGPNVCKRKIVFNITRSVEEIKPTVVKSYRWCVKVPPRCSVYETKNVTVITEKNETLVRDVDECCEGYIIFGRRCVPICSNGCGSGTCIAPEQCECELGYTGLDCKETCSRGRWGINCKNECTCNNATCDPFLGECICPPGRTGKNCEMLCPEGKYGIGCLNDCLCRNKAVCHPESGRCECQAGYRGIMCDEPCQFGYYGEGCGSECKCLNGTGCDPVSGACLCPPGFMGFQCENHCQPGKYGKNCEHFCDCHNNATCDSVNGLCFCQPGYIGEKCQRKCPAGSYGENCLKKCDCYGSDCNHVTGVCKCPKYWVGEQCDNHLCPEGYYGANCDKLCGCKHNYSIQNLDEFHHKKYEHNRFVEVKMLTEKERLIFKYVEDGDYKSLAKACAEGINMNIADINNNYQTPLHLAAKKGCVFTMLTVLGCGVHINAKDGNGNTPLHLAVIENQFHICSSLLYNEADPYISNADMKTPYQLAKASNEHWVKYTFEENLLHWYQKVRKLEKDELKLLAYVQKGFYGNVGELCTKGVDVQVANIDDNHNTAFHIAAYHAQNIGPVVLTLLRCGGDINARNSYGNTPLHIAVSRGHVNATITLLQYRANPFIGNNEDQTAYELAKQSSDPSLQSIFNEPLLSWYLNTHFVV